MENRHLSISQKEWLCRYYPTLSNEELARRLGKSVRCIAYWGDLMNLHKTLEYLHNCRQRGAFITNQKRWRKQQ